MTEQPPASPPGDPAVRVAVAVLGTGIMGAAMARSLCRAGHDVRVWNRTRARAEPLAGAGARVADDPADAVAGADVVLTVLYDGAATLDAMRAAAGGLAAGTVWMQSTTAGPEALEPLAAFAREHGLVFADVPVLGTRQPAEDGTLVALAAAPHEARDRLAPVLDAVSARTVWAGERPGDASRLKLVCNSWVFALTHGAAEAVSLAEGLGVDPRLFLDAVGGGPLDVPYLRVKSAAMLSGDLSPSFRVETAVKDSRLIAEAARAAGLRLDLAEAGTARFTRAASAGHGGEDIAASYHASFSTPPDA
ncbi:NAD(P)-dependent oxidoreductase [Streptomyces sp. RFCAC02]|uniref:NAD(P)-dependent oxidoreductase n=1 Tax=Streptomyces sp. RFCAC02 TaxID=2499143 RepID=UPI001021BA0D|nr:NAD(P)-dependent oxidoreductase [Streptomyces sp. RFCAC02]